MTISSSSSRARTDTAVLFDLDGVLVDSRIHHLRAWRQFAKQQRLNVPENYFEQTFGLRNDAILGGTIDDLTPDDVDRLGDEKEQIFRAIARGNSSSCPASAS